MKEIIIKTSDVIKRALSLLDISIDAFASFIDKDRATVYRYFNGEVNVPLKVLTELLDLVYEHGVDIVRVLGIENEDDYFYHASSAEITFPINVYYNEKKLNDFGYGFYLGENLRQSSTWGKLGQSTIIYRFKKERFNSLKIFDFNSAKAIDWLNFIAINRRKIRSDEYPQLFLKYKKLLSNYDFIKGKIADSFSYEVIELLYRDRLDIDQVEYSTKIMALGNQYCLKNDEFAKTLIPDDVIKYDSVLSSYFHHYFGLVQEKQNKRIDLIINKAPNPHRLFSEYIKRKYE